MKVRWPLHAMCSPCALKKKKKKKKKNNIKNNIFFLGFRFLAEIFGFTRVDARTRDHFFRINVHEGPGMINHGHIIDMINHRHIIVPGHFTRAMSEMSVLDDSRDDLDLVREIPWVGDGRSLHSIPEILVDDELVKCLLLLTTFYDNICSATKETKKCRSNLTLENFFSITLSLFNIAVATWMLCRADVSVNIDCLIASIVFISITLICSLVLISPPAICSIFLGIGFSLIRQHDHLI